MKSFNSNFENFISPWSFSPLNKTQYSDLYFDYLIFAKISDLDEHRDFFADLRHDLTNIIAENI